MAVNPIPEGYRAVIPYLIVDDAAAAIDFYVAVFDGTEVMRMPMDGRIGHAEIAIGDAHIMLSDESPEQGYLGPKTVGGTASGVMVYLPDVDAAWARAIERGAAEHRPVEDQFYGDRTGTFVDPFGHRWTVATHIEDVSHEEMERRMADLSHAAAGA